MRDGSLGAIIVCVNILPKFMGQGLREASIEAERENLSGRVSLANLNESDYRLIGRAMRRLIEEYVERFNAATGKKLDKTTMK